jgi:hypothetical protein
VNGWSGRPTLVDAAAHWQGLADQREEVFAGVRNDAFSLLWEGQAADALHQRTGSDYNTAMDSAGNLRQAAMIAKDGASTLALHRRRQSTTASPTMCVTVGNWWAVG